MSTHTSSRYPSRTERFDDVAPLIGAPPVYGPPVILLLGPWLLLVLLLVPPFALLFAVVLVLAVAALLVAAAAAVLASPYLLVRHFQGRPAIHPHRLMHVFRKHRAAPIALRSLHAQTKGMS